MIHMTFINVMTLSNQYFYFIKAMNMGYSTQQTHDEEFSLIILIDHEESYEFMLKCRKNVSFQCIRGELEKHYDEIIKTKTIYIDQECRIEVDPKENIQNTRKYFVNLTYQEYEAIIKMLFFTGMSLKSPSKEDKNHQTGQLFTEKAGSSTVQPKSDLQPTEKQISKFDIKLEHQQAKRWVTVDEFLIPTKQVIVNESPVPAKPKVQQELPIITNMKVYPENHQVQESSFQITDINDLQRAPKPVNNKDCCALI